METKQSETTNVVYGLYGGAVRKHGNWKVIGGHSPNSGSDHVYAADADCLPEIGDDVPVYANSAQFNDKNETTDFVTKKDLLDTAKQFLEDNELLVTDANMQWVAENALSVCDWQDIESYIMLEMDDNFDAEFLPDKLQVEKGDASMNTVKQLVDVYGTPMHYIPEDEYGRLGDKLLETIDDDREEFEDIVERYNLTDSGFYTVDHHTGNYSATYIELGMFGEWLLTMNDYKTEDDMLNDRNACQQKGNAMEEKEIKELKKTVELTKESIKWTKIAIGMNRIAFAIILLANILSAVILLKDPTYANIMCSIVDTVCIAICSFQLGTNSAKKERLKESQQNLKNAQDFLARIDNASNTKEEKEQQVGCCCILSFCYQ